MSRTKTTLLDVEKFLYEGETPSFILVVPDIEPLLEDYTAMKDGQKDLEYSVLKRFHVIIRDQEKYKKIFEKRKSEFIEQ